MNRSRADWVWPTKLFGFSQIGGGIRVTEAGKTRVAVTVCGHDHRHTPDLE
ncbi:hypothetical protein [Kibdelosporangium philippinense]|uniref:hypothetical protein n=1 Tax=Kibdelosporangium philippinense TaxID=211113 RepID=UPI00361158D9